MEELGWRGYLLPSLLALTAVLAGLLALGALVPTTAAWAAGEQPVCPGPAAKGFTRCHAWILRPQTTAAPTGLVPSQILGAYGYSTSATAGAGTDRAHLSIPHRLGVAGHVARLARFESAGVVAAAARVGAEIGVVFQAGEHLAPEPVVLGGDRRPHRRAIS